MCILPHSHLHRVGYEEGALLLLMQINSSAMFAYLAPLKMMIIDEESSYFFSSHVCQRFAPKKKSFYKRENRIRKG